jgi:hypothetical protein
MRRVHPMDGVFVFVVHAEWECSDCQSFCGNVRFYAALERCDNQVLETINLFVYLKWCAAHIQTVLMTSSRRKQHFMVRTLAIWIGKPLNQFVHVPYILRSHTGGCCGITVPAFGWSGRVRAVQSIKTRSDIHLAIFRLKFCR